VNHVKGILIIVAIVFTLAIVGQMDYEDACKADKHCKIEK
jgi:hypothetical protein